MDVVYILGKHSLNEDRELLYSLRSVEKYLKGYRDVYVIGECPAFLSDKVIHIPSEETPCRKALNIKNKIELACMTESISPKFFHIHDDHFLLKPTTAWDYPYYHKGWLLGYIQRVDVGNSYRRVLVNTYEALQKRNLPAGHFDIHTPIIYDKQKFIEAVSNFDWETPSGYACKSIYSNFLRLPGEPLVDCKIDVPLNEKTIYDIIEDRHVFSVGDNGMLGEMSIVLENLYPEKSKYEK